MVGALNVKTAKPLPSELEKFVSTSGEHGFIIVSFGTNVASLPKAEVDMLAEAFGKLKQSVVWRVKGNMDCLHVNSLQRFANWRSVTGADPGYILGGGALVSFSTSTPISHIVFFFCRIPVVLENRRSSPGGRGGCGPPAPSP